MFDFQKLTVYGKAKLFYRECRGLCKTGKLERHIADQLARASLSVALNIAEGSGKFSRAHRRNYFVMARASIFECVAVLDILHDEGQIQSQTFKSMLEKSNELSRMLYSMILNLERQDT
ncbi:MAG: four helix bundle protein [Flavobacteriales bacterium]|jgi:four helix bundle protein